jgi:hypothetical protein
MQRPTHYNANTDCDETARFASIGMRSPTLVCCHTPTETWMTR